MSSFLPSILQKAAERPANLTRAEMVYLLGLTAPADVSALFHAAYQIKLRHIGPRVSLRGLIEMGNICAKDCLYCGLRKSNSTVKRYRLDTESVIRQARWAYDAHYGSVAIQSGEIEGEQHTRQIEDILHAIHDFSGGKMGITLSLGEQSREVYERWKAAGAHRYLLRIETSNPELYARLHPCGHDFNRRSQCLDILHELNYQNGSGVMIGLPGQTLNDLAADIEFFHKKSLDMIGMGPWLPHPDTPLGQEYPETKNFRLQQLALGLKMIAVTRIFLHNVNIAATTALQTLAADGREQGLLAGANVIMPNITDTAFRSSYQLYPGKPAMNENSDKIRKQLSASIGAIGESILWDQRGDSPHWQAQ